MTNIHFPFDDDVDWEKVSAASDGFCMPQYFRESLAELMRQLDAAGYAVVKLADVRALADRWSRATIRRVLSDDEQPDLVTRGFAEQLHAVLPKEETWEAVVAAQTLREDDAL